MKSILYLLQKEIIQIFRNKTMLPLIFLVPIVQLLVLSYTATFEMKNIELCIVDKNLSEESRLLSSKFQGSPFYRISEGTFSDREIDRMLFRGDADAVLVIPQDFSKELESGSKAEIQLLIDAVNSSSAGLIKAYTSSVIADYQQQIVVRKTNLSNERFNPLSVISRFWYNPELDYKTYMVPGILVILVTMIAIFLTAMNIVREKEIGTMEQINVTPIRKYAFIIGKLLPSLVIALFELAFGLLLGKLLFDIPIIGSIPLLFGFTTVYLLVVLSLGLLISTLSSNQQQVMFVTFFVMLLFILMSGIFTPTESMPEWAQKFNIFNPLAYFMRVIRMIMLKGSDFADVSKEFYHLLVYGLLMLGTAVWRYRKVA